MNFWRRPSKEEIIKMYKQKLECILANPPNNVEYSEGMEIANKLEDIQEKDTFLRRLDNWFYRRGRQCIK